MKERGEEDQIVLHSKLSSLFENFFLLFGSSENLANLANISLNKNKNGDLQDIIFLEKALCILKETLHF